MVLRTPSGACQNSRRRPSACQWFYFYITFCLAVEVSDGPTHTHALTHTHTHTRLTALCPGLPGWASTRRVKPIWILLKHETVSGSGISWAVCKPTAHTTQPRQHPTPQRPLDVCSSSSYISDQTHLFTSLGTLPPNQQRQSTNDIVDWNQRDKALKTQKSSETVAEQFTRLIDDRKSMARCRRVPTAGLEAVAGWDWPHGDVVKKTRFPEKNADSWNQHHINCIWYIVLVNKV